MFSKGFYSFYVFVLLIFIALAINRYFSMNGRALGYESRNHMQIQMTIYASNLIELGKNCLRNYSVQSCKHLKFDFEGYHSQFFSLCQENACVIDVVIESRSILDSNPMRYTQRAIWNIEALPKKHN